MMVMATMAPTPTPTPVGLRVKEMRERRGLTQEELADLARLKRPWIQQIETGRIRRPGADMLSKLAVALDVEETYLTRGQEPETVSMSTLLRLRAQFEALRSEFERAMGTLDARLTGDPTSVDEYVRREQAQREADGTGPDDDPTYEDPASGDEGAG